MTCFAAQVAPDVLRRGFSLLRRDIEDAMSGGGIAAGLEKAQRDSVGAVSQRDVIAEQLCIRGSADSRFIRHTTSSLCDEPSARTAYEEVVRAEECARRRGCGSDGRQHGREADRRS
jgi:hypothetical protein